MKQPQRTAVRIFDAKAIDMVRGEYRIREVTEVEADSNYLGGAGLMSGAVFGRLAGRSAGVQAKNG